MTKQQLVNNLKCLPPKLLKLFNTKENLRIFNGSHIIVKYMVVNDFIERKQIQKVFNIYYSIGKKTFKIIYQLSCFVDHPVYK